MDQAVRDYVRGLSLLAALALLALAFVVNPMPWSPLAHAQQQQQSEQRQAPTVDLSDFDIPEGWAPGSDVRVVVRTPTSRT